MLRITLIEILSFLLPFIIFMIWRWQSDHNEVTRPTPVLRLAMIGLGLAIVFFAGMVVLSALRGGHEGDQYVPPRMVDGEIVPGHFVPAGEGADEDEDQDENAGEDPPGEPR